MGLVASHSLYVLSLGFKSICHSFFVVLSSSKVLNCRDAGLGFFVILVRIRHSARSLKSTAL